ncbi:hypothetical protein J3R83DRAFT_7807 [Lanmaoa asiatica]|nr:hypothetical protein J3R83DRAFT_7807 [Lanmaoa asiatica]
MTGRITDAFLNRMLAVSLILLPSDDGDSWHMLIALESDAQSCGPVKSFKRLITPANKSQGFGFTELKDPDSAIRCLTLLQGVELPALEDGCANKKLLVRPIIMRLIFSSLRRIHFIDQRSKETKRQLFLDACSAQKTRTDTDEAMMQPAKANVNELVQEINRTSQDAANNCLLGKEKYAILPHLHDLQKLISTRPRHLRDRTREREKAREVCESIQNLLATAPSGPKLRDWGKPQSQQPSQSTPEKGQQAQGKGLQNYSKPVGFVEAGDTNAATGASDEWSEGPKTDEEMERDRRDARRRDEDVSFKDRECCYEPRELARIAALERSIVRQNAIKEAEERDRMEMQARLDVWDDDESDDLFYVDRAHWRQSRACRAIAAEEVAGAESRAYEEREAENLRIESEKFLARQMEDM